MKEIDDALILVTPAGGGGTARLHVDPPSRVRKISVGEVSLLGMTHAIREESAVIFQTLIFCPEEFSGVTSLQFVPPSVVRRSLPPVTVAVQPV
jgi:hypothetical protein